MTNSESLKKKFPLSWRFVITHSFGWFILLLLSGLLGGWVAYLIDETDPSTSSTLVTLDGVGFIVTIVSFSLASLKLIYAILYRLTFSYIVEGNSLVIKRGIILRERIVLSTGSISEITIGRTFVDLLFGLAHVKLFIIGAKVVPIYGLLLRNAQQLAVYLERLRGMIPPPGVANHQISAKEPERESANA